MKKISIIILLSVFTLMTSCAVYLHKDNGRHKGWYKNPNNPHNPNSTKPGKVKGKSKSNKFEPTAIFKTEINDGLSPNNLDNNYFFNLVLNPDFPIAEKTHFDILLDQEYDK
ncbi:hypothetical protein ACFLSA_03775 [Bacteroidota bacterium]